MKKIIIIGATSGIGRGLAEVYSQEDYLIGITGRRENLLEEVCARDKDKLFYQVCDITDTQATISSLKTLTQKMGGMDILIICAGTGELNPELSYQLEEPTLLTNVIGFTNIADWGFRYFEQIRKTFLWFAVFLIGKGMLWGNVIGLAFCFIQSQFGIFKLDPENYYVDTVSVSFNIWFFLLINAGTLLASVLMLIGPSFLITKINPASSMRYE